MSTKYIARYNGKVIGKRTTKDRTYTHAVVAGGTYVHPQSDTQNLYEPGVVTWCGRPDLARKAAASFAKVWSVVNVVTAEEVIPARATRSLRSLSGSFDPGHEGEGN